VGIDELMKTVYTTGEAAKICKVSQQTIIRCFDNETAQRLPRARLASSGDIPVKPCISS
jgi:hypothetical protein